MSTTATAPKIKWTRVQPGLYRAEVVRPDLGLTILLEVERGDMHNARGIDHDWWRFGSAVKDGRSADSSAWDYATRREATAAAEHFARTARFDGQWGLVY